MSLQNPPSGDEMAVPVVRVGVAVDAHSARGTAVDEFEGALLTIYGGDDSYVVNIATPASAIAEEDQVARKQFSY